MGPCVRRDDEVNVSRRPCESRDPYAAAFQLERCGATAFQQQTSVVMGPCVRRDDEVNVSRRPCGSRDPYAAAQGHRGSCLCQQQHRWLWVPAFAGTTRAYFPSPVITGRTGSPSRSSAPARATTMSPSATPLLISTRPLSINPTSTCLVSIRACLTSWTTVPAEP